METKITKRTKLLEVNNEMAHNYYYLIHGRFYNDDKTKYRKFKFVEWFDIFDIQEYFEDLFYDENEELKDGVCVTDELIKEYLEELIFSRISMVTDYDNQKQLKDFYQDCNHSITNYNKIARYNRYLECGY